MTPKEKRLKSGWSLMRVAAAAGVAEPTAKLYELDPELGVRDPRKREALAAVYASLPEA